MKKCSYCGRENPDSTANCLGCGTEFESDNSMPPASNEDQDELVHLTICPKLEDADLIASKLEAAGIEAFIPDRGAVESIGVNFSDYGGIRVQVRLEDYQEAKKLLPPAEEPEGLPAGPDGKRVIASMEAGQTTEILDRLKKAGVPVEVRNSTDESGLDLSEILVEDAYFNQGCDVVEAWSDEIESKTRDKRKCPNCGSSNLKTIPHDKLGSCYQCDDCGQEFY